MKVEVIKAKSAPIDYRLMTKYAVDFTLGDGSVSLRGGISGAMKIAHTESQKEYLYYKADKLAALTDVSIYYYDTLPSKPRYSLQTKSHTIYTDIYNKMYPLGKKALYPNFVNQMDWESIAYLYMDDGSICDNGCGTPVLRLSTQSFSYADNVLLQTKLQELGCPVNIRKDTRPNGNVFWYLRLPTKAISFFIDNIKPFINPCCQYKLFSGVR